MERLFSYDNPVMRGIGSAAKCVGLCLVCILCCLPVVTIGAATSALYYSIERSLKNDRGYVISSFFEALRRDFRQSLPAGILALVLEFIFLNDFRILYIFLQDGQAIGYLCIPFAILMVLVPLYLIWTCAVIARFDNTLKNNLKNSLILMLTNPVKTILMALILLFAFIVIYIMPISILIMPVVALWLITGLTESTFRTKSEDVRKQAWA